MAVLALGLAGSALGGAFIGGAIGSQIGWLVGTMIGNALFPPPAQEGPRLSDLKMTTSAYGQALPLVYGSARISGNCFWSTDKSEHKHSESHGGKGGGGQVVNTYTYTVSIAFALCQGPIKGIRKMWASGKLVYDSGSDSPATIISSSSLGGSIRIYLGDEDQMPDSLMQATDGISSTPAYRGTAYVLFQDLDISQFGNQLPNFEFEVVASGSDQGPRILKSGSFNFSQIRGIADGHLFNGLSEGNSANGYSIGSPIIAAVKGNTIDMVSEGDLRSKISVNEKVWAPGHEPNLLPYNGLPNGFRFTADSDGNFVSIGSWTDYRDLLSSFSYPQNPPNSAGVRYQSYQYCRWLGKAGLGDIWMNNEGPINFTGISTISDQGYAPCNVDTWVAGRGPSTTDDSDFFAFARSQAGFGHPFILGVYPSGNGKYCLVIYGSDLYTPKHWIRYSFNGYKCLFDDKGEIDSSVPSTGYSLRGYGRQVGNRAEYSGMVEDDGLHLWVCSSFGGVSGASCFKIDSSTKVLSLLHNFPTSDGLNGGSIYAFGSVAFAITQTSYYIFTRAANLSKDTILLGDIVGDICARAGLASNEFDVSELDNEVAGTVFGNMMSYRSMLEPLRSAYFFDCVEVDGRLKFVKRGHSSIATIAEDDLAAVDGMRLGAPADQLTISHMQDLELPSKITVDYFARDADYQEGSQYAQMPEKSSVNQARLSLPIALTDNEAASIAAVNMWSLWEGRNSYEFKTSNKYTNLMPCDIVVVKKDGKSLTCRIMERSDDGNGIISWKAQADNPTVYTQTALGGVVTASTATLLLPGPSDVIYIDAPPLMDSYGQTPCLFLAGNGFDTTWKGVSLYQTLDGGNSFIDTGISIDKRCVIGRSTTALAAPASFGLFDETNTVDIFLSNGDSELSSDSEIDVLNRFNSCYLGGEIVGFKTAIQIGPRTYRISGLLRGQKGTEDFAVSHLPGEDFALLSTSSMQLQYLDSSSIGKTLEYKPVTFGDSLSSATTDKVPFTARNMRPLSTVQINATKSGASASSDWNISWTRRTRIGGDWRDYVDAQLGETSETYDVEIYASFNPWPYMSSISVKRTFSGLTSPNVSYTLAQQADDGCFDAGTGMHPNEIIIRVYQTNGVVGRSPAQFMHFTYVPGTMDGGPFVVVTYAPSIGLKSAYPLMHFDSANGSTNFKDESAYALALTAHGGLTISTDKSKFGNSSALFDGSSGYLTAPSSNGFNLTSRTFTIDFWINPNVTTTGCNYVTSWGPSGSRYWLIQQSGPSTILFASTTDLINPAILSFSFTPTANAWTHLAFVCYAGSLTFYVNGAVAGTGSISGIINSNCPLTIGRSDDGGGGGYFSGYLDECRVINNRAVWGGAFSPPSRPYNGADLLLHMDGVNGSTSFVDSGDNSLTLTASGSAAISTAQSKFGGTSAYFPGGTSDYLKLPSSTVPDLGSSPFTVSAWVYIAGDSAIDGDGIRTAAIANSMTATNFFGWNLYITGDASSTGNGLLINGRDNATGFNLRYSAASCSISHGAFHFISASFDGTNMFLALDGVQLAVTSGSAGSGYSQFNTFGNELTIGGSKKSGYPNNLNGYIDEFSITKGVALYTANFTPPSIPYGQVEPSLLLHMDGSNGSSTFTDSSVNGVALTVNGSVSISTTQSKFGGASCYIPGGNGNFLTLPSSPLFYFGTDDFTVDSWINVSGYPGSAQSHIFSTNTVNGFGFYIKANGMLGVAQSGVVEILSTSSTISIGSWTHVAITRSLGVSRLFINGALISSYSSSITFNQGNNRIGSEDTEACFNGYIDELRVVRGVALWTASFTPPVAPYSS